MLDLTVGIWMTEDPLGFDAGAPNLRRYVHNNPTNLTDPSGLAEPANLGKPIKSGGAIVIRAAVAHIVDDKLIPEPYYPNEDGTISKSIANSTASTALLTRRQVVGQSDKLPFEWIKSAKNHYKVSRFINDMDFVYFFTPQIITPRMSKVAGAPGTNIMQGTHALFRQPKKSSTVLFGTGGAGPCVGLIILNADATGAVFHFEFGGNAIATLSKYHWESGKKKRYVYVFGGEDYAGSRALYNEVITYCRDNLLPKNGHVDLVDSSGLLVGAQGEFYVRPTDLVGQGDTK